LNLGKHRVVVVVIDADWSALRFRKVEHVKRIARDATRAMSAAGKARAATEPGRRGETGDGEQPDRDSKGSTFKGRWIWA
jgi:hypothetical protein